MFTGIVEEKGRIAGIVSGSSSGEIAIEADAVVECTKIGDSIAVNGVCLTVTGFRSDGFTADVMPETLRRSNLGTLRRGDPVNLERAMAADGRFGGHIVSGHIDGTGRITQMKREENAVWVTIEAPKEILDLIVEKGSIAIDGISLTVAYAEKNIFKVSTIPHTRKVTTLSAKRAGDAVNLECDIIGKYVEKMLNAGNVRKTSNITESFLEENGFI